MAQLRVVLRVCSTEQAENCSVSPHRSSVLVSLREKMLQCAAEGRIDDDGFAPPQAQDLPDDGADVVHIHLLYDPMRLDLSFKSIAQRIEFIGRFGEEQWRFRQKCQLIFSAHLLTPLSYPDARAVVGRRERVRAISKKASKLRYMPRAPIQDVELARLARERSRGEHRGHADHWRTG